MTADTAENQASTPPPSHPVSQPDGHAQRYHGHRPRVVVSGYYGFDNLGDELILEVLIRELKARHLEVTVLSHQPEKTAKKYGVKAIHRMNIPDIVDEISHSYLLVSGGGGLFQDVTGPNSVIYYGGIIHIANFFEVPVVFWAQGVGPLNTLFSRNITRGALNACRAITVRDHKSADLVERILHERPVVTADPVWMFQFDQSVDQPAHQDDDAKFWNIGVSLRPWPTLTERRIRALAKFFKQLAQPDEATPPAKPVRFLFLTCQESADPAIFKSFETELKALGFNEFQHIKADALTATIGRCHVLFGMRYHSLLLALLAGVPVYGLIYDPKVQTMLEGFGLGGTSVDSLEFIDPDAVRIYFDRYPQVDVTPYQLESQKNLQCLDAVIKADITDSLIGLAESL